MIAKESRNDHGCFDGNKIENFRRLGSPSQAKELLAVDLFKKKKGIEY